MPVLISRLKAAWAAFCGRERARFYAVEGDAEAELRRLHTALLLATRYLKELPVALIEDINALGTAIDAALAGKDTAAAGAVAALAAANAEVATMTTELATADAAVVALTAKLTPAPAPVA